MIVNVSNPNFVDIQGKELLLDIYYQSYDIGTVDKKDFVFPKLSNSVSVKTNPLQFDNLQRMLSLINVSRYVTLN